MPTTTTSPKLTDQDHAVIHALIEPWCEACVDRDWDRLLSMCTDDIVFLPPNEEPVHGADAIRAWLDAFPVMTKIEWGIDRLEGCGDVAGAAGWVAFEAEADGETVAFSGKYCDLLRKERDGMWRFSSIMWSANAVDAG